MRPAVLPAHEPFDPRPLDGRARRKVLSRVMSKQTPMRRALARVKARATRTLFERGDLADTSAEVRLGEVGLDHPERILYSPSSWLFLPRVMRSLEVRPDDVFVDFGSGKGRVVLQAARHPFARVVGVEISEELNAVARENVARAGDGLRCQRVELVTADVVDFEIPDDMTHAYFYYPFFGETFRRVVDNIVASLDRRPRKVAIIFTDPREVEGVASRAGEIEACLEATGRFRLVRRHRLGLGRRHHSISVYANGG
jgi:tRNA G46 methylase TrmB